PVTFSAVPTMLAALLQAPGADEAETNTLRFVICGAASLSPAVFRRFEEKFGVQILEGYGLTEGTCCSTLNPFMGPRKIGSIGLPTRGQEVVVLDDRGERQEAAPGARSCPRACLSSDPSGGSSLAVPPSAGSPWISVRGRIQEHREGDRQRGGGAMKAAVFRGIEDIRVEDVPEPEA